MTLGHSALRVVGIGVSSEANVDETTALLSQDDAGRLAPSHDAEQHVHGGGDDSDNDEDNTLPIDHILALCAARIVEPIAFFSIFPFINQMIWDTGQVAQTDVGFYSGLIVRPHLEQPCPAVSFIDRLLVGISLFADPDAPDDTLGLDR